jgi:hypothetical protein
LPSARRGSVQPLGQRVVADGQHGRRQQSGVDRAGASDRQCADRDAGRHLHDRQQRILAGQRLDSTGTPKTGSGVSDAVMPGRCAAPPAPAMITESLRL